MPIPVPVGVQNSQGYTLQTSGIAVLTACFLLCSALSCTGGDLPMYRSPIEGVLPQISFSQSYSKSEQPNSCKKTQKEHLSN